MSRFGVELRSLPDRSGWLWKDALVYSSPAPDQPSVGDGQALSALCHDKDLALTQSWEHLSLLLKKVSVTPSDDAIPPELVLCAPTMAMGVRHCAAIKGMGGKGREAGEKTRPLDPRWHNISSRDQFLTRCAHLFCEHTQGQALEKGPLEVDHGSHGLCIDRGTFIEILMGLGVPNTVKQDLQACINNGGLEEMRYGPEDFIKRCMELCPYPEKDPPLPPSSHHEEPWPPLAQPSQPAPKAARWISNPRRAEADPDVVVECAKRVHRDRRKTREARERLFKDIFTRLHEKPIQKTKVNACMRPDRCDPFVSCGKTRLQGLYNRKKKRQWDAKARNLTSGVEQMAVQMREQQIKRNKELELRQLKEVVRLAGAAAGDTRARLQEEHAKRLRERRQGYLQKRQESREALTAVSTASADRLEAVKRRKRVFHLSDHLSTLIPPDEGIVAMKKAATKLSQWQEALELEADHRDHIMSSRLSSYRQATRGAMEEGLRAQTKLPYLDSQQVLDGSHVFVLRNEDEEDHRAFPSWGGYARTAPSRWLAHNRDVPSEPFNKDRYLVITGNQHQDKITIPFAMRSSHRVFRGLLNRRPRSETLSLSDYVQRKKEAQKRRAR